MMIRARAGERGAVLIVSLIMLAVMTLFVLSMFKTSVLELKIGGTGQVMALNSANADIGINNFISVNNGSFAPSFLNLAAGTPGAAVNTPPAVYGGTIVVTPIQLSCGGIVYGAGYNGGGGGGVAQPVQFDIKATATGAAGYGGTVTVHQGVSTFALSCL